MSKVAQFGEISNSIGSITAGTCTFSAVALVLPETGQVSANLVARRICDSLANDGREPKLSVSIGVAVYPKDGEKLDFLLVAADVALYSMKARTHSGPDASTQRKPADLRHKAAANTKTG